MTVTDFLSTHCCLPEQRSRREFSGAEGPSFDGGSSESVNVRRSSSQMQGALARRRASDARGAGAALRG